MPSDLLTLLRRDHAEFQTELTLLLQPAATTSDLRTALDGVRLGLVAHAEAEDIALGPYESVPGLQTLVARSKAAHLAQEGALSALVCSRPGSAAWRHYAQHLHDLIQLHAAQEERQLIPVLRDQPSYGSLAAKFATSRLQQLAMLQPSAPFRFEMLAG